MDKETKMILEFSSEILDIIYHFDEFTTSDLQGAIEAQLFKLIQATKNNLSVDEWLEIGKKNNFN